MGLGGVISNLQSLGAKLLPFVSSTLTQAASSSSAPPTEGHEIETDLKRLMKMLKWIEANLYDAEERVIRDHAVKLWLKELKKVAYDAEDVLDEYHYEVLRAQVEAREASPPNPRKRKQVQVPDDMFSKIKKIMDRFDEIERDRLKLRLFHEDAPRRADAELQVVPTSHFIIQSNIFGREREKEDLIDVLSSECHDGNIISVVTIVGTGGLGKTTLAQLVFNDERIKQRFDKLGWVCVSEDFNVQRLTREVIESITKSKCALENLSALQNIISGEMREQSVFLVLDDVWNENITHWENFRAPFASAARVKILVTTRNEPVAQIMQTVPSIKLGYLSEEQCWNLFQHYAFGQTNQNACSKMVDIGKEILKKCGGLPLAVKSIASLLRHEKEEESWREILESELWESDASKEIFPSLQISYSRLPTHLKHCFLFCSIFPKDCSFWLEELVQLWTSHGYIISNGKKNSQKIGVEYAKQLWQRSFLEGNEVLGEQLTCPNSFKLHDVVHDLARFSSGNGFYSIEAGKVPNFPGELYHLYVDYSVKFLPLPSFEFTNLRTLILKSESESEFCPSKILRAQKLRALEIEGPSQVYESEVISFLDNFKHLRYLFLHSFYFERLPKCICSLYNLQILTLKCCDHLQELPESIVNLISLEELGIYDSPNLRVLPESFCQLPSLKKLDLMYCSKLEELPTSIGKLTNLQTLTIQHTSISSLPLSFTELSENLEIRVYLFCKTIDWLQNLVDLGGNICLCGLNRMPSLTDVQCGPLLMMHNLGCLELSWRDEYYNDKNEVLNLKMECDQNFNSWGNGFATMSRLQPHHNLRALRITCYRESTFPEWIRNSTSCPSLSRIILHSCAQIESLPFGGLCSIKYLEISLCFSLRFLGADSLPPELQQLIIHDCATLKSVSGIRKLKSLHEFSIRGCVSLQLVIDVEPSHVEVTSPTINSPYHNSLLGLRNLASLRSLEISGCPMLRMFTHELPPVESCQVNVSSCLGLKEWCTQHNIAYKDNKDLEQRDNVNRRHNIHLARQYRKLNFNPYPDNKSLLGICPWGRSTDPQ